ncbi:MAG: DUF6263 family protein [Nonlabens sp.]
MKNFIAISIFFIGTIAIAQETIRLNLEVGKTYTLDLVNTSEIKQVVAGMPQDVTTTMTSSTDYVVTGMKGKDYMIDIVPTASKTEQKTSMGSIVTDSNGPDSNPMNRIMKNLTNRSMKVVMTPQGKVVSFDFNGYTDKLMDGVEMEDMQKLQIEGMMKEQINAEKMQKSYSEAFTSYPTGKVAVGDEWKTTYSSDIVIPMETKLTNTLKESTPSSFIIESMGTLSTNGETETQLMGMAAKADIQGDVKSMITIDKKTGWISKATTTTTSKGYMKMAAGGPGTPEMKIDMDATSVAEYATPKK